MEKISYDENSSVRFKNIKRFETELKWIKFLQTPFPLGFNDNIYHEGNISKMPDFDVLTLSESRKRKSRSHGIRKKGNDKRKRCATMKLNTSLNDLAVKLRIHGRHPMLSYLSSLPIAVLRSLDTEANRFYDRNHQMYDAALFTDFCNRWCKREGVEDNALKECKRSIFTIVDKRIKFYSQNTNLLPPKPKSSFRYLKQGIQEFHRKYVLVPADKATNNVVVVCRLHYVNTLKQELDGTRAYLETDTDEMSVVNAHLNDLPVKVFCLCQ